MWTLCNKILLILQNRGFQMWTPCNKKVADFQNLNSNIGTLTCIYTFQTKKGFFSLYEPSYFNARFTSCPHLFALMSTFDYTMSTINYIMSTFDYTMSTHVAV